MKTKIYQSDIDNYFNEMYIENALININNTINAFDILIKDNNINFNEYIDIISKIYNIQITDNDLLRISSIILGETTKYVIIDTDIIIDMTKRIQNKNNFEYIEEKHKLYIKIAYIDNNLIIDNYKYNISEILKMINNKKIILLDFIIDEESDDYCNEININGILPLSDITHSITNLKYINENYKQYLTIFLKKYFTVAKLKKDLSNYLKNTKDKLENIENYIKNLQDNYSKKIERYNNIIKECKKIREKNK